mmetsp:Transcript_21472/g.52607  ORF Transcript_21472/g.52607 Transcript_21472/m.52607 type:complete len:137 (+) Transcript_21472:72-482(+)
MRENSPDEFDILTKLERPYRYRTDEVWLEAEFPVFSLNGRGELTTVRFNERSAAPLCNVTETELLRYYNAWIHLGQILESGIYEKRAILKAGDILVMNNSRILHGRTVFEGTRHLQGCYVDSDGVRSKYRMLRAHS